VCLLQALSMDACVRIARFLAWLACDVLRLRRALVEENIQHAFPELNERQRQKLMRASWEHVILICFELVHAPRKIHESNYRKHVLIVRKREIVTQLVDPRPTCLVTGHYGNFEMGGYLTGVLGFPTHTVARTIDNPYLDDFLLRFREAKMQFILPKAGSAVQADAVLETGGTLVLLGDQHAGKRGCKVDFLHRTACCHKALALFTLVSGAPMMVNYCRRRGKAMQFEIGLVGIADPANPGPELADARRLSQWYMDCLAQVIRETPDQYWWVHRLWREPAKKESAAEPVVTSSPTRAAA
jgi:KDO2-lipid IV(A) lauroyltransferase